MSENIIDSIELLEYGVFKKSSEENFNEEDGNSPSGYFIRTKDLELLSQTTSFSPQIGTVFGIKYRINSKQEGEVAFFLCKIIHPEIINPETNETFTTTCEEKSDFVGEVNFDFFEFEYSWESKKGTWTFQLFEGSKLLLSKDFQVK